MNIVKTRGALLLFSLFVLLCACGGDLGQNGSGVVVRDAWARAMPLMPVSPAVELEPDSGPTGNPPKGEEGQEEAGDSEGDMKTREAATNSAVYLLLENRGPEADRLLGGATSVARALEIHESRVEDGVMRMRPVEGVDLPPGETVAFQPGGLHIMLVDLQRPLRDGDAVSLTLRFMHAAPLEVSAEVRGPGGL